MLQQSSSMIAIKRRLIPLYVSAFFQSLVLWYSIEKLFMRTIGFSNTGIGLMIAVYSAVMLAIETPSGVLADRWSRKGVLILASMFLALSGLIGGLSHSVVAYLFAAISWGVFFACYSGMYDSIIYDVIAEEGEGSGLFDSLYGRIQLYESVALVIGSISGSYLAKATGLRAAYFLTIPLSLISILALIRFREPTLHKKQLSKTLKQQFSSIYHAVLRNPPVLPVVVALILQVTIIYTLYEFAQLWLIALHAPTQYYGIANAFLLSSYGAGGILVERLHLSRYPLAIGTLVIMLIGFVGLIVFRNTAAIVVSEFIASYGLVSMGIIFRRLLHDSLAPNIRAGAASAASTSGRFLIIPIALVFGYVSKQFSIFKAAYILLALAALMAIFIFGVANRNNRKGLEAAQ